LKQPPISFSAWFAPFSLQNFNGAKISLRFLVWRYAGKIDLGGKISVIQVTISKDEHIS